MDSYIVKLTRGGASTIMFKGTLEEAKAYASDLNKQYQTDEYFVEIWKQELWMK